MAFFNEATLPLCSCLQVVSVNFQPFLRNAAQPVKKEKYYTNYINVDFPENIFTRNSEAINQVLQSYTLHSYTSVNYTETSL